MKKALSILLSLLMVFSAFSVMPFSAFALDSSGQCGDDVYWSFDSASGTLTLSGTGDTWDYTLDDNSDPICNSPFFENRDIKTINVESGVTGLGDYLFFFCYDVESISLPEGLTKIGEGALNYFSIIENITIPSSVTSIGSGVFSNWHSLKSIAIPDGVTSIEFGTFFQCYDLESVVIPKSVTSVGEKAFYNCTSLTDVYYYGIEADRSNMTISSTNNSRFTDAAWYYESGQCGDNVYYGCTYGSDLGENYKNLFINGTGDMYSWDNADNKSPFNGDIFINRLTIGSGVTNIGDYAFTGCTALLCAAIPKSVNAIGEGAFASSRVNVIVIPDGVETLEENVFSGCTNLNQLYIPSSVTAIKKGAFKDAPLSDEVFLGASGDDWSAVTTDETDNETLLNAKKYFGIPGAFDGFKAADINAVNYQENEIKDILVLLPNDHKDKKITLTVFNDKGETVCSEEATVTVYLSNFNFSTAAWTPPYLKSGEYTVFAYGVLDGYISNTEKDGKQYLYYGLGAFTVFPTESSTYTISNYAELKIFANMVNGTGAYAANGPCTGMNGVLTEDITATDKEWTPIGNYDNRYIGTFDGGRHTITGLSNEDASETPDYAGLFGVVGESGVIQNVCTAGAVMKSNTSFGAIAGWNPGGIIQYCCNTGAVSGNTVRLGGITGNNNGVLQNCFNTGAVTNSEDDSNAGGITGYNNTNGKILNSCNTGEVTGTGENTTIAGVASCNNYGEINNCYNTGVLTGSTTDAGEIVGWSYGPNKIKNCYYDSSLCDLAKAIGNGDYSTTVKGLTTAQMTGTDALSNMTGFDDTVWMVKADGYDDASGKNYWYYPHLKGFNFNSTGEQETADDISAAEWPAKAEAAVTWNEPESYKYTGSEIKPTVTSITLGGKALDSSDYTVSYQQKTDDTWKPATEARNAGDYKAIITFTADGHANIEKAFTINKADLTITANNQEYTYNGYDQGPGDVAYDDVQEIAKLITVKGLKGTDAVTSIIVDGQGKNADTYELVPQGATVNGKTEAEGNYNITYVNGVLKINPKKLDVTVFGQETYARYNGTEQSYTGTVLCTNVSEFDYSKFSYTGNTTVKGTNAGDYEIKPSVAACKYSDKNYTINWIVGSPIRLTITQCALDITADNKETNHGSDLAELTYTIDNLHSCYYNEDELNISISTNADKNKPGTYDITVSCEDNPNYAVRTFSGTYTVGNSPHYYGTQGDERFTCTVCGAVDDDLKAQAEAADKAAAEAKAAREKAKAEFIASVDGTSTESSVIIKWGKVPNAKRYVIYAAYCDKNHKYKYKKIKTVSGKVTKYEIKKLYGKKLNPKKNVKVYIVAQKKKNGKWRKIFKTPTFHFAGAKGKFSNVQKITVKKNKFTLNAGKTAKIKAKIVLVDKNKKAVNHVAKFRYRSTNTAVVKVTKSGKIKAVGKGKATVFVYSNNGTAKAIKVTVK